MKKLNFIIITSFFIISCSKEIFLKKENNEYPKITTSLTSDCIKEVRGKWEIVSIEDSMGNILNPFIDTVIFSIDSCEWFADTVWYNIYEPNTSFANALYSIDCENGIFTLGHLSCGVFFEHYRVIKLNNNVLEFVYDPILNGGQRNSFWGYRYKYHKI